MTLEGARYLSGPFCSSGLLAQELFSTSIKARNLDNWCFPNIVVYSAS